MRQHQSLPEYKNGRYLKLAIGTCIWHEPPTVYLKPYGGTWPGYTFGPVLILWLMLPGVRKGGYRPGTGSLQGWASAHVYDRHQPAGHCHPAHRVRIRLERTYGRLYPDGAGDRRRFHRRVAYLHCPALMTANPGREQVKTIMQQIAGIDHKCRRMALACPTRSTRSS